MSELEPDAVEVRRAARERALELLYEAEAKSLPISTVLDALPVEPDPWALEVAAGVGRELEQLDALLAERVAPKWSITRLASTDRAILRMATYELLAHANTPTPVILNEAVVLARRFGTDESGRFVNGVLSALASQLRSA